jgi:hypothetical protein
MGLVEICLDLLKRLWNIHDCLLSRGQPAVNPAITAEDLSIYLEGKWLLSKLLLLHLSLFTLHWLIRCLVKVLSTSQTDIQIIYCAALCHAPSSG